MSARQFATQEILEDIRKGMGMSDIMDKHRLSSRNLQGIVTILLDAKFLTRNDLYGEFHDFIDNVFPEYSRQADRIEPDAVVLVYESERPEAQGHVIDINMDGIGVMGIDTQVDDMKKLVVLGDAYGESAPVEFKALCRWKKMDQETGLCVAGFQIIDIATEDKSELENMINKMANSL